jgi:hypothetical protein
VITHVAIIHEGVLYSLPKPKRHHHVIRVIADAIGGPVTHEEQGFLDDKGRFLDRKQALAHALENNQVKNPNDIRAGQLFSEDVW